MAHPAGSLTTLAGMIGDGRGALTFLFTDIAGSTAKWRDHPEAMAEALESHDGTVRGAVQRHDGEIFKHTGDGVGAVFNRAEDALAAAVDIQTGLRRVEHPEIGELSVRIGIHAGEALRREGDYFGYTVSRTARIMDAGHGGQILVSEAARALADASHLELVSLGEYRLRDLGRPERLFQLSVDHEDDFPPLRTLDRSPNNLPTPPTSFVGRERELSEVLDLAQRARVVTISGVGGSGKTRLALQAAAELARDAQDGAWLVELAAVSDPAQIVPTFVEALGITSVASDLDSVVLEHLRDRSLILVVDNCEHLIDAVADVVSEIVAHAADVTVIATSRELLGVPGEVAFRLRSMNVPTSIDDLAAVMKTDAIRLFADRARDSGADFEVTAENVADLVDICKRLDGIPLAIELAAARLRTFSVAEIKRHLDQRFRLLTGGSRTALPRQQTLAATIEWSYRLLDDREAVLFRRLAVFLGGFTYAAVVSICTDDLIDEFAVLELLPSLVDKSLVSTEEAGADTRYRLLETLRQFARDRLDDSEEIDTWRRRHAIHFAEVCREATVETLVGSGDDQALPRFSAEVENIRQALTWSIGAEDADLARQLLAGYARVSDAGVTYEFLDFDAAVTAIPGSPVPTDLAIRLHTARAWALYQAERFDRAIEEVVAGVERGRRSLDSTRDDRTAEALELGLNAMAYMLLYTGRGGAENERYVELENEGLDLAQSYGHRFMTALFLANIAHHRDPDGDPSEARRVFEQAEEAARQVSRVRVAGLAHQRGFFEWHQGEYADALHQWEEGIRIFLEVGDTAGARSLRVCAEAARAAVDRRPSDSLPRAIEEALEDPARDPRSLTTFAVFRAFNDSLAGRQDRVASIAGVVRRLEREQMNVRWDLEASFQALVDAARDALGTAEFERLATSAESFTRSEMERLLCDSSS